MRFRGITALILGGALAVVGLMAAPAQAGPAVGADITLSACTSPVGATTDVSWSGYKTGSLKVEYRKVGAKGSVWSSLARVAPASTSGTQTVTTPAKALAGTWYIHEVHIYGASNGKGKYWEKHFDCGQGGSATPACTITFSPTPITTDPIWTAGDTNLVMTATVTYSGFTTPYLYGDYDGSNIFTPMPFAAPSVASLDFTGGNFAQIISDTGWAAGSTHVLTLAMAEGASATIYTCTGSVSITVGSPA